MLVSLIAGVVLVWNGGGKSPSRAKTKAERMRMLVGCRNMLSHADIVNLGLGFGTHE